MAVTETKKRERAAPDALTVARRIVKDYAVLGEPERSYVKSKLAEIDRVREQH